MVNQHFLCSSFIVTNTTMKMITYPKFFQLFLVFLILLCEICVFGVHPSGGTPQILCLEKERQALLKFKQGLTGTNNQFSSWGTEEIRKDCCEWPGVHCHNRTGNVIELNLYGEHLSGVISPSLLELKYLKHFEFSFFNFSGPIPVFFGSFTRLKFLRLFNVGFEGRIPRELGNLSSLDTLDLSYNNLFADNLEWLLPLQSLRNLYLYVIDLSNATDWLKSVNKLPLLRELHLFDCQLPRVTPSLMDSVNSSTSLAVLDVSFNDLGSSIYTWLFNYNSSLSDIDLSVNNLQGPIPDDFAYMVSLMHLDLSSNELEGGIPSCFGNFSSLESLFLSNNNLTGHMPKLMKNMSGRVPSRLEYLYLDWNLISGPLPDTIAKLLPSLRELYLENNQLRGALTKSIGSLSNLEKLHLRSNNFEGAFSESHLLNLSRLQLLDLSFNSQLELRFRSDWIPPFQLDVLNIGNCKIGPHFPKWLQTQKNIYEIDISAAGISGHIPSWFWSQMSGVSKLNLSFNFMDGTIPELYTKVSDIILVDLSSNRFEGPIPQLPNTVLVVDFSRNRFSGNITFLCNSSYDRLGYLDLSDNQLSGEIPDCWSNRPLLFYLNLANNNLFGKIPPSMGSLHQIQSLHLRNNSFTGELPQSWEDSEWLSFIDIGHNKVSGVIPTWVGSNLSNVIVLGLSSNNFSGNIPHNICNLSKIQVFDLSGNNISGTIPKCINNLYAMTQEGNSYQRIDETGLYITYSDEALLTWKGRESQYKSTLGLVKSIDLSSNNLMGDIPLEVTDLIGLIGFNLSRNHLSGFLAPQFGNLKSLNFLDLSRNQLQGEIPSNLSEMNSLGMLNLSFNNFTGRIPPITHLQTFDASSFEGNPRLCGKPLTQACPGDPLPHQNPNFNGGASVLDEEEHEDKLITKGFFLSIALGFIIGFWGVCGTLFFNRSCRHSFFRVLNEIEDWFCGIIALKLAKLQRRLQG